MKIYVVETVAEDTVQLGFSTSQKVAQEKAKRWEEDFYKYHGYHKPVWVSKYSEGKDKYCVFE